MKHKKKAAEIHLIGYKENSVELPGSILLKVISSLNNCGVRCPELRIKLELFHPRGGYAEWKPVYGLYVFSGKVNYECLISSCKIEDIKKWMEEKGYYIE